MNEATFLKQKQDAAERMRQMSLKNKAQSQPEAKPKFEPQGQPKVKNSSLLEGLNIPFLDNLKSDGDATLILGILLLLLSEKADKKLLFALIYILL